MGIAHHPIAIIGAGLGGLTLARVLHVNGIEAVIFDLDVDRRARTQGGMLDIHDESGQAALRTAQLHEQFLDRVHPGGEAMRVLDKHATVLLEEAGERGGGRPEIDRGHLRDLLLDSLPESVVRWGGTVTGVRPVDSGRHEVVLADGATFTAGLLVGADGAWSRVRQLVSAARPVYTGISFVEMDLLDADTRHPESAALIGGGMFFALGDNKALLAHRETDGSLHIYSGLRAGEDWPASIDRSDIGAAKAALLGHFSDWAPALRRLITDADGALVPRPIHALPVGHRWERSPGVTLLGDAADLMSPFAGEGANLAMLDGAELGQAIATHNGDVEAALVAYETPLFDRSEKCAVESAEGLETIFNDRAPLPLVDAFTSFAAR